MSRIHSMGMGLAFGNVTGAESQSIFFRSFRPRFVKLAHAATQTAERSPRRQDQIKALERVARENNCEIIAEGIRTKHEKQLCRQLGCHFGQGPLFGDPQQLEAWAHADRPRKR